MFTCNTGKGMPYTLVDGFRKKIEIRDHMEQLKYVPVYLSSGWPGTSTDCPYLPAIDKRSTTTVFPDDTAPSTVRGAVVSTHAQKFEPFSRRKWRYLSQADSVESFWGT